MTDRFMVPPAEGARMLGIGRTLFFEILAAGKVDSVRLGRKVLIPVAELERFAASLPRRNDGPAKPGRVTRDTLKASQEAA